MLKNRKMVFIGQTSKESKLIPCWNIMFRSKKENYELFISLDVCFVISIPLYEKM